MSTRIPQPNPLAEEVARLREQVLDLGEALATLTGRVRDNEDTAGSARAWALEAKALLIAWGEIPDPEARRPRRSSVAPSRRHGMHAVPEVAR